MLTPGLIHTELNVVFNEALIASAIIIIIIMRKDITMSKDHRRFLIDDYNSACLKIRYARTLFVCSQKEWSNDSDVYISRSISSMFVVKITSLFYVVKQ